MRKSYKICFWGCCFSFCLLFVPEKYCRETSSLIASTSEYPAKNNTKLSLAPALEERLVSSLRTYTFLPEEDKREKLLLGAAPLQFDRNRWERIVHDKGVLPPGSMRETEGMHFDLPYDSKLSIAGRKLINVKFGKTVFKHPNETTIKGTPAGAVNDVGMEQELNVKIKGKVGPKIAVNIDYDDTKEDKRDISVVYKGDPEEVVQEAAFGDIDLALPQTEFVAYNKKLFGGKIDTQPVKTTNHRLRLLGIGSRTKGITETKKFKGNTTFDKREILDTQYMRRKYYKIFPSGRDGDLPIQAGSEEIYIDNKNAADNKINTVHMTSDQIDPVNGNLVTGDFDKQYPGVDYTIDYRTGIITFSKPVGQNHVIVVNYKTSSGAALSSFYNGRKKVIKDELETPAVTRELKNHYSLGSTKIVNDENKFILKILDLNRQELNANLYPHDVDYDFGIIRFREDMPFAREHSDIYTNFPNHYFTITVEYYHSVKTYNLRPGIVPRSETIRVNGETLNRDEDYFVDYEIGLLTFLKDMVITTETEIEVSYEYMPFGGLFQQTIVGARTEYEYADRLLLGSTVLYNWATPSGNVPDVRSTPESILVLEADSKLHLEPQRLWRINLEGLEIDIGGEIAKSKFNPNIFGKAMIDNMEGSELADGVSTDRNVWSLGSLPLNPAQRGILEWSNDNEVKVKDINSNSSDTGNTQVLDFNYVFNSTTTWVSLLQSLSKTGVDYSKHLSVQLWIHGEGKGETLHIDLGRVSEDADGQGGFATDQFTEDGKLVWPKGAPKTEDKNNNGVLDVGEDVGWEFLHPTQGAIRIGAGNGRLDSEDLDGDGILATSESIPTAISAVTDYPVTINWTGWRQVILPLDINDANITIWQSVKHARIWLEKGAGGDTGTVRIAQMEIVGNRWDKPVIPSGSTGNLEIRVLSEEDNSNVLLKNYSDYVSLYKDTVNKDLDKNKVISLVSTNLTGDAYIRRQFTKSQDYSKHGQLRFFVRGDGKSEKFYFRIGADDNNYYEYKQDITWTGWETVSIALPDGFTSKTGFPTLENISVLKMGIIGTGGSGEIWVDEIHLTEPKVETGQAQKFSLGTRYTDWGTANATYRDVDDKFGIVGVPRVRQSVVSHSISSNITKLKILPLNFSWDKTKTVTPSTYQTNLSSRMEGIVVSDNLNLGAVLSKQDLPRVGLSFKRNNTDSNLQQRINRIYTYGIDVSYYSKLQLGMRKPESEGTSQGAISLDKVPSGQSPLFQIPKEKKRWFGFFSFLVPDSLNSYYNRIHGYTFYGTGLKKNPGFEDLFEETDDWMVTPTYQWQFPTRNVNRLTLTPSYKRRKTAETKEFYNGDGERTYTFKRKKSDTQTAGLAGQLDLLRWLNPTFRYSMNTYEVYNVDASSKNVNRNATSEFTYLLRMKEVWGWKHLESLSFNNRYKVDEGDIYENVVSDYRTMDKLLLRQPFESGLLKSTNRLITYEHTTRWAPLKYFMLAEPWAPLKTIDITSKYTKINEHRVTTGTPYDSYTKIWPDLVVTIADLEKFMGPLQKKRTFLEQSQVTLKYNLRQIDRTNISYTREDFWSINWVGRWFKRYTLLLITENTRGKDYDTEGVITRNSKNTLNSGQVSFRIKNDYQFILRYEDRKQTDFDRFNAKSETTTKTPSVEMKKNLEFPHGLRIPFSRKIWYLKNTVQLNTLVKTIIQRSTVADKNNNTYSGSVGVEYNLSSNFALSFGVQGSKVKNIDQEINDYYTYGGNVKLLIRF